MISKKKEKVLKKDGPVIAPEQSLPEITTKAIFLSIFLIVLLAASNAYLGLKVGATISASIPAVVIAMGILPLFRQHSVLEINIVQTAASVGEGLTAGIAYTLPALIIMHFWLKFNYLQTVGIGVTGGILGVLFSIPLRKALIGDKTLRFPEGVAIAEVMKASLTGKANVKLLLLGGFIGALISFFQTGLLLENDYQFWQLVLEFIYRLMRLFPS